MPRPRSLHPDRLAEAALAVIDRAGPAGLTMRAVAQELGLSVMALYRYVADRDELELLVTEWLLRDLDTAEPDDPAWTHKIKTLTLRVRDQLAAHPQAVPVLIDNRQRSLRLMRWAEAVTVVLTAAGFTDTDRVLALRAVTAYLAGALLQEHRGPLAGPGTEALAALPEHDFPLLSATARTARTVDAATEFTGGLDLLLHGLAAQPTATTDPR